MTLRLTQCANTPLSRVPPGYAVAPWREVGNTQGEIHRLCLGAQCPTLPYRIFAQEPDNNLGFVTTPKTRHLTGGGLDDRVQAYALEAWPVDKRQEPSHGVLCPAHSSRQSVRGPVRP